MGPAMARPKAMLGATATVPKVDGSIGGDKRIFSMYIFHYSCLIFKYFGYVAQEN
jgi:hypothetical protein